MSKDGDEEDVHVLSERLAKACREAGLDAHVLAPTRVRVAAPKADSRLTEIVRCFPRADEELMWWWSWDEPICRAADIAIAVKAIFHVVTPDSRLTAQ